MSNQDIFEDVEYLNSENAESSSSISRIVNQSILANYKISSIVFEEIFEVSAVLGQIRNGVSIDRKDRIEVCKAIIKKVLSVMGFDYM